MQKANIRPSSVYNRMQIYAEPIFYANSLFFGTKPVCITFVYYGNFMKYSKYSFEHTFFVFPTTRVEKLLFICTLDEIYFSH